MPIELRTVDALVAAANAATDPAEIERHLAAACAQAAHFQHWKTILDGLSARVNEQRRREVIASMIESARTQEEIWGFKNAAVAQARDLGEPDAARETLRAGERMLVALDERGESLGFYWGALAEGFAEALRDAAEAARALEAGWELAWRQRDVENLGRLANKWSLLDPRAGAERLLRVEQAAGAWGQLGGLIYWWHALGDPAAAHRVRQATVETTSRFEEALDLARHWTLYEKDSPGVEAAFARAESLAATASEWFELAQEAGEDEGTLSRRALDRAAAVADGAAIKARIACAYVEWFGDDAAAAGVGPRGVRPDDLRPVEIKLDGWKGSAAGLFDWLRARVTREQLLNIAGTDYGNHTEIHLGALEQICSSGLVPIELSWHPGEVVALTRWSEGDGVDHVERALSCVLLCLAARDDELANTGAPLVESVIALGPEAASLGERLMVWKWETTPPDADERFVALLALCILRATGDPGDPRLDPLLRRLRAPDARGLRECLAASLRAGQWAALIESTLGAHAAALGFES
jgi:hypothetical protein